MFITCPTGSTHHGTVDGAGIIREIDPSTDVQDNDKSNENSKL